MVHNNYKVLCYGINHASLTGTRKLYPIIYAIGQGEWEIVATIALWNMHIACKRLAYGGTPLLQFLPKEEKNKKWTCSGMYRYPVAEEGHVGCVGKVWVVDGALSFSNHLIHRASIT
jgi:hypothetical protein